MTELHELSALDQARAVASGELSPVELTRHYLERIERIDSGLHAFVTVTADLAETQAKEAEQAAAGARRAGGRLPALHGVPVVVKDLTHVEDVRCTLGSAAFADQVSEIDEHVVTRLRESGTILLGKTNTPEFALPCYTENNVGEPTRNPWDPARSPGGSSGGSAAAVAAGLTPLAHGTDAGGSIRIPASACGLVGVKPSRGRVSQGPLGHDVTGLSEHGPLARSVADAAALLDAMTGAMPGTTSAAPPDPDGLSFLEHTRRAPGRLKIVGMPNPLVEGATLEPECHAAYQRTADMLSDLGHEITEIEMDPDPGTAAAFAAVWSSHAASQPVEPEDEYLLTPFTRHMRALGAKVTGADVLNAMITFRQMGGLLAELVFCEYDVILTPTLAQPPALIGEFRAHDATDPGADFDRMSLFMPYTPMYNVTGLPAVTLPLYWSKTGLPIGVMLGGRYAREGQLLSLAAQLESAAGDRPAFPYEPAFSARRRPDTPESTAL